MIYRVPMGRRNQFLLLGFCVVTVMTVYYFGMQEKNLMSDKNPLFNENPEAVSSAYVVDTPGCKIPNMDPFDKFILKHITNPSTVKCSDKLPLIRSNQRKIWIDEEALKMYNVINATDFGCCYSEFSRFPVDINNIHKNVDNVLRFSTNCEPFQKSAEIQSEFVEVTCKVHNEVIYKDYHAFIVPKPLELNYTGERKQGEVSVMIVGVDSLSRLNFYRQMPRTKVFLNFLESIEFLGYNKVHDNTFTNLVPLLSGYSVQDIRGFCWLNDSAFFDDCPWIWKNFSAKGFFTELSEEGTNIGLFNYLKNGFVQSPTDYYLRPYMLANEWYLGHNKLLNMNYCIGARFASEVLIDYAYKFSVNMTLENKKFWAFFWESSLTHDFLNVPINNDNIFLSFLKGIYEKNVLNSTVLIFMSDHGMRWGAFRETYQGRMEENLPFLHLVFPDWFKKKYSLAMKNIILNKHRLTTHFDVYETMKDLLDLNLLEDENLRLRMSEMRHTRGISLFLPIPRNRTCKSADINPKWCTCQRIQKVYATNKIVQKAVNLSVDYLNAMLADYKECAQLKLKKVLSAEVQQVDEKIQLKARNKFLDYLVRFVTEPGLAKFESIVRHHQETNEMKVLGDISRLNIYGTQSHCVKNYRLKLYCNCI